MARKADITKIIMAVSCFPTCSIADAWQGSEYDSGSEDPALSLILNVPEIWIYKGPEYAISFEYTIILNMPGSHRV